MSYSIFSIRNERATENHHSEYIGIVEGDVSILRRRPDLFLTKKTPELKSAIQQHGWESFSLTVLEENLERTEAYTHVLSYIGKSMSHVPGHGYNYGAALEVLIPSIHDNSSSSHQPGRRVRQLSLDGQEIAIFESIQAAADAVGGYSQHVGAVCRSQNGRKSYKGYRWEFADACKMS